MKKLNIYLFLFLFSFQTSSWADDIRDFQIEGISIGDSALDYFSEDEINTNIEKNMFIGSDGKFTSSGIYKKFGEYDGLQFAIKPNDKNLIIYAINGGIFFSNINECNLKRKSIRNENKVFFI